MTTESPSPRRPRKWIYSALLGAIGGALLEVPALFLAVLSGGLGHGHYVFARALFPVPMLATLLEGDTIGPISQGLAFGQFPLYGAVLGLVAAYQKWRPLHALIGIHLIAAVVAFAGVIPNFS